MVTFRPNWDQNLQFTLPRETDVDRGSAPRDDRQTIDKEIN